MLFIFYLFSLTAMCQTRIHLFFLCFFKKSDVVLVSYKLELGNFLIVRDISLKNFPVFRNPETTFERCCTKVVVQRKGAMKYSLLYQWSKARKGYRQIYSTRGTQLHSTKGILQAQKNNIEKHISIAASEDNCFLRQWWMASSQKQLQRYIYFKVGLSPFKKEMVYLLQ